MTVFFLGIVVSTLILRATLGSRFFSVLQFICDGTEVKRVEISHYLVSGKTPGFTPGFLTSRAHCAPLSLSCGTIGEGEC